MRQFTTICSRKIFALQSSVGLYSKLASTNPLESCDAIIQKYAKHNLKAFFSYYQTSSWSKITYLNTTLNATQVKTLLVQGMVMETYYLFPW